MDTFVARKSEPESFKVTEAELKIAGFFADHHVPYAHADHLLDVLKSVFPTLQKCNMKRTKTTYLLQEGIGCQESQPLIQICRTQPFLILIDESRDASVTQVLAVVVRYFDEKKNRTYATPSLSQLKMKTALQRGSTKV